MVLQKSKNHLLKEEQHKIQHGSFIVFEEPTIIYSTDLEFGNLWLSELVLYKGAKHSHGSSR